MEAVIAIALFAALAVIPQAIDFGQQHPLEMGLLSTIPIGAVLFIIYLRVRKWRRRQQALRAIQLADVDNMPGRHFERYLAALFRHHGYHVTETGRPGDQGCDLLLSKDGKKIVCQAKRYQGPVSNDAIQQAFTAVAIYGCHRAMVVTNSTFTKGAKEAAAKTQVELFDRERLGALIASFRADRGLQ